MRSLACLAFGLAIVVSPLFAHAQDGQPPFRVVVCDRGTIKVVDSRTGMDVPCVVMRAGDKPPVVRVVEGPASIVLELALDKKSGNLIRVSRDRMLPPKETAEDDKKSDVEKQLEKALKELDARKKVEEAQRRQADKALADFRKQAEDARVAAEKKGQEAIKELERITRKKEEDARKKEKEACERTEKELAETRKELDKYRRQEEQEARKKDEDARKRVEKQLEDARRELDVINRMKKEDARKQAEEARKHAEKELEEARNAKIEQMMNEINTLRKDNEALKKRLDGKQGPESPWPPFNPKGKGPPFGASKQATPVDLQSRLERILEEAEALRREIQKAKKE